MKTLDELFEETLKDVYYAEKALAKALPKLAKKAGSEELREALLEHAEMTQSHIDRLDRVFKIIGAKAKGRECPSFNGLMEETDELVGEAKSKPVLDAGLIGCAQAVEHYEIARYGTLRAWAEQLGHRDASRLLDDTLEEEKETDRRLTRLAEDLNPEAQLAGDEPERPRRTAARRSA